MLCMNCSRSLNDNEKGYCLRCGGKTRLDDEISAKKNFHSAPIEVEKVDDGYGELPPHLDRLAASIIDAGIVGFIALTFIVATVMLLGFTFFEGISIASQSIEPDKSKLLMSSELGSRLYLILGLLILAGLTPVLYSVLFESSKLRATPGKLWLGLEVSDALGGKLNIIQAFIRFLMRYSYVVYLFIALAFLQSVPLIGFLLLSLSVFIAPALFLGTYVVILIDSRRRGLHDMFSSTQVTKAYTVAPARAALGYLFAVLIFLLSILPIFLSNEKKQKSNVRSITSPRTMDYVRDRMLEQKMKEAQSEVDQATSKMNREIQEEFNRKYPKMEIKLVPSKEIPKMR